MTEKSDELAAKVSEELDKSEENEVCLTLSNGVRVRLTPPPMLATQLIAKQHPEPRPPVVEVTGDDGRTWQEENPNDPDYQRALAERRLLLSETLLKIVLLKSMHLEYIPDTVIPFESDEWREELSYLGVEVPEDPRTQKLYWIRYEILGVPKDFEKVQDASARLSGASEEDIAEAEARFRSLSERDTGEGVVQL